MDGPDLVLGPMGLGLLFDKYVLSTKRTEPAAMAREGKAPAGKEPAAEGEGAEPMLPDEGW